MKLKKSKNKKLNNQEINDDVKKAYDKLIIKEHFAKLGIEIYP